MAGAAGTMQAGRSPETPWAVRVPPLAWVAEAATLLGALPPAPPPPSGEVGGDRAAMSTPCIRGGLPRAPHTAAPAVTGCAPSRSLCPPPSISPHGVCPILFVWHNG